MYVNLSENFLEGSMFDSIFIFFSLTVPAHGKYLKDTHLPDEPTKEIVVSFVGRKPS